MKRLLTLTVAVVVLGACGKDRNPSGQPASSSTQPPAVTATTSAPTSTAAITSTTVACALAPIAASANSVTSKPGDFDGNGAADTLRAYQLGAEWRLRVELAGGGGADIAVPGVAPVSALKALGGYNIDANLRDEAFAVVGSGASTAIIGLWTFANCQLTRVTVGSQPAEFPVGATVQNQSGLSCVQGTAIQALKAQLAPSGTMFNVQRMVYDLVGNTLVLGNTPPLAALAPGDPNLAPYSRFACGSLTLN